MLEEGQKLSCECEEDRACTVRRALGCLFSSFFAKAACLSYPYNYINTNSRVRFLVFCGVLAMLGCAEAQLLSTRKVPQSLTPISL